MITKEFAEKLATAKTDAQLDIIVEEIIRTQFPTPIKDDWNIPTLEEMETEAMHLISYWNDKNVSSSHVSPSGLICFDLV